MNKKMFGNQEITNNVTNITKKKSEKNKKNGNQIVEKNKNENFVNEKFEKIFKKTKENSKNLKKEYVNPIKEKSSKTTNLGSFLFNSSFFNNKKTDKEKELPKFPNLLSNKSETLLKENVKEDASKYFKRAPHNKDHLLDIAIINDAAENNLSNKKLAKDYFKNSTKDDLKNLFDNHEILKSIENVEKNLSNDHKILKKSIETEREMEILNKTNARLSESERREATEKLLKLSKENRIFEILTVIVNYPMKEPSTEPNANNLEK